MGSGSSSQPEQTQSAPPTARQNAPKRNNKFEEVQIKPKGQGSNPKSRQQARSQGASPNPGQSTGQGRSTRGQDPGASGSQSDRKQEQSTQRQGAAANGRARPSQNTSSSRAMPQQVPPTRNRMSYDEYVGSTKSITDEKSNSNKGKNPQTKSGVLKVQPAGENSDGKLNFKPHSGQQENVRSSKGNRQMENIREVEDEQHKNELYNNVSVSQGRYHDDLMSHDDSLHNDDLNDSVDGKASGSSNEKNHDRAEVVSMKDDDLVFETFYHRSGKEFQCIYQGGMRFYLDDWGSKEWQPFPKRWYNEGLLVTNTILKDDSAPASGEQAGASGQQRSSERGQGSSRGGGGGGGGGSDDREGYIDHPKKGRIPTYIFYKKHNVHMYFDREIGNWVRMPIGWELHHDMVKSLVDQVEEAIPTWGDRADILSLLRACNYDASECISIYLALEHDVWMKVPKTSKDARIQDEKEQRVVQLEEKVRNLQVELEKERNRREELERNLEEQTNTVSELEAEVKQSDAHISAMTGGRPKSARPISVMMVKQGKGAAKGAIGKGGKGAKVGEVVNADDVIDLNANAIELRKAHTKLKIEVERYMGDLKVIVDKIGPSIKQMKAAEKGTQSEIEEVRALYRKEALQRKLLYNQLQELRGNIRVFCRVRKDDRGEAYLKFPSDQDLLAQHPQQGKKMFSFDKVFGPDSTQEQVFDDTKPIITSCVDGYNVCLLAYGQTGSGKTFTMMGPDNNPGINIRAMKTLFEVCQERKETMTYTMTVAIVEIYNEHIQDLLSNDAKTLDLRTAGNKVDIPGLTYIPIKSVGDVKAVMTMGDKNRHVASTKMNSTSSRSHLVLMLRVEGLDKVTEASSHGTLTLCDLAGSERIGKTEAEGQRLVEAAAINKSLSALGQVFSALRSSQLHVPYRNSKLTQILQPSLGGDAKACLFVNVSPDMYNYSETVSTLTFGGNARQVALGQAKQNVSKGKR